MSAVDLMQALEGRRLAGAEAEAEAVARGAAALDVDVAIVGEGTIVSLLAAAVARGGRSVAVVEPGTSAPAPASDLSTVPYSSELALLIGERFGLPEVSSLALLEHAPAELRAASGGKTSLGFVHHRPRRSQDPAEVVQFQVPGEHAEWQPDRAALDAWARSLAIAKGARVLTGAAGPASAEPAPGRDGDGAGERMRVALAEGGSVTARLVVDATPAGAPAGRRTISADFEAVTPYEHVVAMRRYGLPLRPWSRGTLTHTFPGGWLQVTHRGNHDVARATGTGIALTVGPEHVREGEAPDALLDRVLAELPDLRAQLARARRTGEWHDTAAATPAAASAPVTPATDGPRVLRLTTGAHEPLLARELTLGLELVHTAAVALLAADLDDPAATLAVAQRRADALLAHHDRIVHATLAATRSFPLVNALLRAWLLGSILEALALKRARLDAAARGSWTALDTDAGAFWFDVPAALPAIVDASLADAEDAAARRTPPTAAADRIFARLRAERIVPPLYAFGDPEARVYRFTLPRRLRMLLWATTVAPADFRRLLTKENVSGARPPAES